MSTRHSALVLLGGLLLALAACSSVSTAAAQTTLATDAPTTSTTDPTEDLDTGRDLETDTDTDTAADTDTDAVAETDPDTDTDAGAVAESVEVVEIVDGDTIALRIDGTVEQVRLIGINTPERGECFATEATAALAALVSGRSIRLETDKSDRDQYGRLLRYVWADDLLTNEELVLGGYAIARRYEPDTAMAERFESAQRKARDNASGLWAPDACGAPAEDTDVRIVDIVYDAPGDDSQNLNGEWVVIQNDGANPLDMTSWVLKDESSSHRYQFPTGFQIAPGQQVQVFSGCGTNSANELFWCESGSAIWNNSGDTAFLLDPSGNTITTATY